LALLIEWNERGNIVSKSDLPRLVERHLVESLAAVPVVDSLGGSDLVDIGSGGGFPGVPIQIVRPKLRVTLLESRRMKSLFLQKVVQDLGLASASILHSRAEDAARTDPHLQFDIATARAVAAIPELTDWAAPMLRTGGHLVTFKGSRLEEELENWKSAREPWGQPRIFETEIPSLRIVSLQRL
jgi:16S rRNA (guanine527-N7)-methyltransferase